MKGKIMAVAAVLVMVFAAVGVIMPQTGESEAEATAVESTDLGFFKVSSGTDVSKIITTTEGQFTGYAYTVNFYIKDLSSSSLDSETFSGVTAQGTKTILADGTEKTTNTDGYTTFSGASLTTSGVYTVAISTAGTNVGQYYVKATYVGNTTAVNNVAIKVEIVPTAYDSQTDTAITQTIYYTMTVLTGDTYAGTMGLSVGSNEVTGGTYYSQKIKGDLGTTTFETEDMSTGYTWYASNLPAGLSISSTGYLSGIPTATSADTLLSGITASDSKYTLSIPVVAVNESTGAYYEGTLSLAYTPYDSKTGLILTVYSGESTTTELDGNPVVVKTGDEQKITAKALFNGTETTGVTYSILMVDSTGKVTETNENITTSGGTKTFTLNTAGSGSYRVVVTATYTDSNTTGNPTYEDTFSFYLYVMPVFENLTAHITVATSS